MGIRKNFVVPGGVTFDTDTLVVDDPNNRVGIKKAEPEYELDVAGIIKASNGVITLTSSGEPSAESPDGTLAVDTTNDVFYFRSGGEWTQVSAGGASLTVSATAPSEPGEGDLWYNSVTGATYVYYDSFWVETGSSAGVKGDDGEAFINADGGTASSNYGGINSINGGTA
jgi:hypothetical protein